MRPACEGPVSVPGLGSFIISWDPRLDCAKPELPAADINHRRLELCEAYQAPVLAMEAQGS